MFITVVLHFLLFAVIPVLLCSVQAGTVSVGFLLVLFFEGDAFQAPQVFVACHLVPLLQVSFVFLLWAALFSFLLFCSGFKLSISVFN